MPARAIVLDEHADDYVARLAPQFPDVRFHAARTPADAEASVADADIVIALAHKLPPELLRKARALKWVQALTTGTDALIGILPSHVLLTSTRGVHGPQMSELAFMHMLALNRNFGRMRDSQTKGIWDRYPQPLLDGKTIVIVGVGILSEHLAQRCKLFGMRVMGVSSGRKDVANFERIYPRAALREAAALADFLVLLVPLSSETRHLINADILAAMKPSAFLINLARGGVVDEAALIDYLQNGRIAGAGIDVFSTQPLPGDNPLWRMPNVVITPNVGGFSDRFVEQTLSIVAPNMQAFLDGRAGDLMNIVPH